MVNSVSMRISLKKPRKSPLRPRFSPNRTIDLLSPIVSAPAERTGKHEGRLRTASDTMPSTEGQRFHCSREAADRESAPTKAQQLTPLGPSRYRVTARLPPYTAILLSDSVLPRLTADITASIKAHCLSVLIPTPLTFRPLIVTSTQVTALCESPVPLY